MAVFHAGCCARYVEGEGTAGRTGKELTPFQIKAQSFNCLHSLSDRLNRSNITATSEGYNKIGEINKSTFFSQNWRNKPKNINFLGHAKCCSFSII